jgi:hypothetical protein
MLTSAPDKAEISASYFGLLFFPEQESQLMARLVDSRKQAVAKT